MNNIFIIASLILSFASTSFASSPLKVIYMTDNSNVFHDYKKQTEVFVKELESRINSKVFTVGTSRKQLTNFIEQDNFAEGYDLIVYNACLSENTKRKWQDNLIRQTKENGIPMILLHCGLQNFKPVNLGIYLSGLNPFRNKKPWTQSVKDPSINDWWKFTGMATVVHSPLKSTEVVKPISHPITLNVADNWQPPADELYLELRRAESVKPLITTKDGKHLIAWLNQVGSSQIFASTLGHRTETFEDGTYMDMISRAALYLSGRMDDSGIIENEFLGNKYFYNYSKAVLCKPSDVVTARSTEELSALIKKYTALDKPLKVVSISSPNSYSDVICSKQGGVVINLAAMNEIISVDKKNKTVRVQPGVTIDKLGRYLEKYDLVFPTTADFSGITVAGGMGTGAHHSSLKRSAGVHDYVKSITLVDAKGSLRVLKGKQAKNAAIHLGYLGAIVEVELNLESMFKLRYGSESGLDDGIEEVIEAKVRSHDYARVSWFAGVGRYVLDYYDQVELSEEGDSFHNVWASSAGASSILGSLPYDALNRLPQAVQCSAAAIRAKAWAPPIKAVNSPKDAPVGLANKMLGSTCAKGECPWDLGLNSRTQELAIPISKLKDWMQDVRSIIAAKRACFPVLGIYMRFAKQSEAWLASSYGEDVMMFEIHVPKESDPNRYEQGTQVYDEIQQLTYLKYQGRPHWAKNSSPIFTATLDRYPAAEAFLELKSEIDPDGVFENEFWKQISEGFVAKRFPGCTLKRQCICETDMDCASGFSCSKGAFFEEARVCRKK